ncbi:MAG: LacI family DNA-binding transcriptional regulator [Aggregatilineales bacterium]
MSTPTKTKKLATMRDVAKLAGVSQPTVSRVLNQKDTSISISDETREKVIAAVEQLGYRPNMAARSLRTQKTKLIAVLIADITNSFYPHIARSIQSVAREEGYDVMIANSDHIYQNELLFCESIKSRAVDGIILVPIHLTEHDLHDLYTQTNTPISVLGQHINHPKVDVVWADDEEAVFKATSWLIQEKGHSRLGYVGVPDTLPPGPRRYKGFMRAIEKAQLTVAPEHILEGDFTLEGGRHLGQNLLKLDTLPTAFMVTNDAMALGLMLALQEGGVRIPEDVAVIGYDDIPEARIIRPALTTIEQNSADIGYKLAHLLFERMENPDLPSRRLETPNNLVIRDST